MKGKTKRALRNSAVQGMAQILTWSLSWVLLVILPRYLGDDGFGRLFLALTYAMVFGTFLNMGINKYLVKRIAILNPVDDPDADEDTRYGGIRNLVGHVLSLKITLSLALYVVLAAVVVFLPYELKTRQAILIICFAACFNSLTLTLSGIFEGLESMFPPNAALVTDKIVTTGGCALLLAMGYGLVPVCGVYLTAAVVRCVVSLILLRRRIQFTLLWDLDQFKTLFIGGLPFLIWIVFGQIYMRVDVLMLSFMTTASVVGWYGAAFRIYSTLLFVPHILNTVVFPPLARMGADENNPEDFAVATRRVMNLLLSVAVPIGAGLAVVSAPLVLLLYGEGPFSNSIWSLRIFSGCIILVSIDVILGSVLIARGKQKKWSYMAIAAALFNPLMNAWMIPMSESLWQNGGIGAAIATILTEMLMMAGAIRLLPPGIFSMQNFITAVKAALCAALMMLVLHLSGAQSIFILVPFGAVVYGIAAVAIRVLPPEDIYHILHALGLQDRFPRIQSLLGIHNE